jgi:hypothetical protein
METMDLLPAEDFIPFVLGFLHETIQDSNTIGYGEERGEETVDDLH